MGDAATEQAMVARWAWQSFGVALRAAPPGWPPSVDAVTLCDGEPGVTARIVYCPRNPAWRYAVMRELGKLVDIAQAG